MSDTPAPSVVVGQTSNAVSPSPVAEQGKAPEAKPVAPADTKQTSAKLVELAKRERGIIAAHKKLSDERGAFASEKAKHEADIKAAAEYRQAISAAKRDPGQFLKGVYGDKWLEVVTRYAAEGVPPAELVVAAVDEKLEAFRSEQAKAAEAAQRAAAEAKAAQDAKEEAAWADEVRGFVTSHAEEYELIALYGSHDLVPQLIKAEHAKTGKLLTAKEAADKVEEYLLSQAGKALSTKKLQASRQQAASQTRTLSNDIRANGASPVAPARSDDERMQRALARMAEVERSRAKP